MPGWQATFLMGAASVILGLIVAFQPTASLTVIAVLLGILLIFSGIFHIVEAVDRSENRAWRAIAGILFIVGGVVLIRHLNLSLALIGLIIGLIWVVQGVLSLLQGVSGDRGMGRWWPLAFGAISLIAGIVVISAPVASVTTLATLMGIWFVVMGILEMLGGIMLRRAARAVRNGPVDVPGQRAAESAPASGVTGSSATTGQQAHG
ncbi:MAG TPA: HdeD family acid-resistance protein [Trebonia sp.]